MLVFVFMCKGIIYKKARLHGLKCRAIESEWGSNPRGGRWCSAMRLKWQIKTFPQLWGAVGVTPAPRIPKTSMIEDSSGQQPDTLELVRI